MTHARWADEPTHGVFRQTDDTDRITPADHGPTEDAEYQRLAEDYRAAAAAGPAQPFMLSDLNPTVTTLEGANTPTWNGFDTFLRRGVMIAAFAILWTMIVATVFLGVRVVNAVNNLQDPAGVSIVDDGLIGTDEPILPPGDVPTCIPDLEDC